MQRGVNVSAGHFISDLSRLIGVTGKIPGWVACVSQTYLRREGESYISSLRTLQVHNIMSTKVFRYYHLIVKCHVIAIVIDTQDHHCLYLHRHPIFPIFPISCDPLSIKDDVQTEAH